MQYKLINEKQKKLNWVVFSVLGLLIVAVVFSLKNSLVKVEDKEVAGVSSMSVSTISSDALKKVYITFKKYRYGKYATPAQLYTGDTLYLVNYDRSKLKLLQIYLYDYEKRGNQEHIKSRVTATSMYVRTRYKLPSGKRYAYVAWFEDKRTGERATKYFTLFVPINYAKPWTVNTNCPITTSDCVPCTSGADCRFEPGRSSGFRGWACQNNNPGNIRNSSTNMATDSKNKMIIRNGGTPACGVRNDSRGGSYFVFSTYQAGYGALKAYVKGINKGEHSAYAGTGWKCGNCTLAQFFSKYAPGDSTYATRVSEYISEPTSQTLQFVVTNKLDLFVDAIKEREGFITSK